MNLKHLSDQKLLSNTDDLVKQENEILINVLHHLREIERRRLFSDLQFGSLFEYATKRLRYSEDQACRRIAAMRLLREIPTIEEKIADGTLSLTNIGLAQTLFRKESLSKKEFSREKKLEVLKTLEHKSSREAQRTVLSFSSAPELLMTEKVRPLSEDLEELRFAAPKQVSQKLEKLKGLLAHKSPNISTAELIDKLCDLGLSEWSKVRSSPAAPRVDSDRAKKGLAKEDGSTVDKSAVTKSAINKSAVKRHIWHRAQGKCRICQSTYALEIDHILPRAKGGESSPDNLRLLCRQCNQRAAIEQFGIGKMEKFIERN